jgi:hypothetical protein
MKTPERLAHFAAVLTRDPHEAIERVRAVGERLLDRYRTTSSEPPATSPADIDRQLGQVFGQSPRSVGAEPECRAILGHVEQMIGTLPADAPFARAHNGDVALGQICYIICRLLRPAVVVETGVAYGVSTACLLQAIRVNGRGQLHSIDLPPLGPAADDYVGFVVPEELRARWRLYRGTSRRILPDLLRQTGAVGLFCHDSLHTSRNMEYEFATVLPHLSDHSAIIADDVQKNSVFEQLAVKSRPAARFTLAGESKPNATGVCIYMPATVGSARQPQSRSCFVRSSV